MVTDPRAMVDRAWGIVRAKRYCLMITESPGGPVARVIEPVARAADGTLWFGTDPGMAVIAPEPFGRRQARLEFRDGRWELIPAPAPR